MEERGLEEVLGHHDLVGGGHVGDVGVEEGGQPAGLLPGGYLGAQVDTDTLLHCNLLYSTALLCVQHCNLLQLSKV